MAYWLWNYCDYHVGVNDLRFRIAARLLSLLGCSYWIDSVDYQQR